MVSTAPKTEIGSVDSLPGWGAFSTVTQDVTEPTAWAGQQRVATVNRMRVDAQIDALCSSLSMPIMRMRWQLNPNGARDEIVEQISTDLGIPIKGSNESTKRSRRRFKHRDHLEHALLALWYGHMFFEQVPDTENFDLATDGWRLRKLAPRMPSSIDQIHTARDGGLAGISQIGWAGSVTPKTRRGLTLIGTSEPQIGVNALAAYVWKREGSNWSGRSMLRPLYRDWVLKDRALRVDSVKNERFGMGIPTATAPVGGDPTQYAKLAQSIRASEFGGVGLESGASVGIEGIRGTLPDIMESIRYYDESMARSFMAMVIQLGQTQTGSRALGETFADFFQMLVEAVANWYADTTNEHVIEDLVDWNFGEDEQAPLLEWSYPTGEQTLAISELVSMVTAGVITMDRDTQQAIRQRTRLPLLPEVDEVQEETASAATSPFASVGLPALVQAFIISPEEARELLNMTGPAPTPSQVEAFLASKGMAATEIKAATHLALAAGEPTVGHRARSSAEVAAGTNFQLLQETWVEATSDLVAEWRSQVQAGQIDELVEQVRKAVGAGDLVALSKLEASVSGTEMLLESLKELAEDAIVGAKEEALSQGVKIGTINTSKTVEPLLAQRAEATANLLAQGISDSASRKAMNLGVTLSPDDVAASVREHLEGLSDAYLQDMLGGAMTQAQNTGRKEVFATRPSKIYASELLDSATCSVCSAIDGQEFSSLAAAEEEYPTGGHKGCLGGPRCRGTLVAVYEEGDDKLSPEPQSEPEPAAPSGEIVELDREAFRDELDDLSDIHSSGKSSDAHYEVYQKQLAREGTFSDPDVYDAWNGYTGSDYDAMNRGMRTGEFVNAADEKRVLDMQRAFTPPPAQPLPVDTVFRGVVNDKVGLTLSPGQRFQDKGFVSTSDDWGVAKGFADKIGGRADPNNNVPKSMYLIRPSDSMKNRAVLAGNRTESEWVLPAGSTFTVGNITEMVSTDGRVDRIIELIWDGVDT